MTNLLTDILTLLLSFGALIIIYRFIYLLTK